MLVGFGTSNITSGYSVQAGSVTFISEFSPMISVNHVLKWQWGGWRGGASIKVFRGCRLQCSFEGVGSWCLFCQSNNSIPSCGSYGSSLAWLFYFSSQGFSSSATLSNSFSLSFQMVRDHVFGHELLSFRRVHHQEEEGYSPYHHVHH